MRHVSDSFRRLHAGILIDAYDEIRGTRGTDSHAIGRRTFRLLTRCGTELNVAALVARDRNRDCRLSGDELDGLLAWSDEDEDGQCRTDAVVGSEITIVVVALARMGLHCIRAIDYGLHTVGVQPAPQPMWAAQGRNYAQLRQDDNAYFPLCRVAEHAWVWLSSEIKINQSQPDSLIGTDAADTMDAASYAAYLGLRAVYFDLALLTCFYAGGGNDVFGGSARSDRIWGGTGDDVLSGYAGDDHLYGEQGADELHGDAGTDMLFGGPGNDRLYGGAGNDTLSTAALGMICWWDFRWKANDRLRRMHRTVLMTGCMVVSATMF